MVDGFLRHPEFEGTPIDDIAPFPASMPIPTHKGRIVQCVVGNESAVNIIEWDGRGLGVLSLSRHDQPVGVAVIMDAKHLDSLGDLLKATAEKLRTGAWRKEAPNGVD